MLSNFPIEYLDNERMRPMYWSHPKRKTTEIYGFGLNEVKDPAYEERQKAKLKEATNAVEEALDHYLSCCKLFSLGCKAFGKMCKNCCGCNVVEKDLASSEVEVEVDEKQQESIGLISELKQIPAIKFGLRLLNTYFYANDNLIYECFEKQIFHTKDDVQPAKLSKKYNHAK